MILDRYFAVSREFGGETRLFSPRLESTKYRLFAVSYPQRYDNIIK